MDNPAITLPVSLNRSPFPGGWTVIDLGNAVRAYYNALRHYASLDHGNLELIDEIRAPFSYRYWALIKWCSDLRKRLLGQPVIHVHEVYDKDGTLLSDKDLTDIFYQVHHVWHPNGVGAGWTQPTPFFLSSVGQRRRKKEISRTQVGAEFFAFHRDHLEIFDRWLERTKQERVQSINTCAHDTAGVSPTPAQPAWPVARNQLDVLPSPDNVPLEFFWSNFLGAGLAFPPGLGYPLTNYGVTPPTADFAPVHVSYWDGDLSAFSSLGEMGQFFATDNNPFALLEPFATNLVGQPYERLDGFDHESVVEITLIQEKQAPEVTAYLDRSTFSIEEVTAVASGGSSAFDNSFYVILQDRTSRLLNIVWPPESSPHCATS